MEFGIISYFREFVAPYCRARFGQTERGASMVEYALVLALIAVVCIGAVGIIGTRANNKFSSAGSALR